MELQCLYYALDKWNETGGYILFRKSIHWCIPHVLHLNDLTGELTHYIPEADLKYPWYSMFGFEGYIKTGDTDPCAPMHPVCMMFGTVALAFFGAIWLVMRKVVRRNRRSAEHNRRQSSRVVRGRRHTDR